MTAEPSVRWRLQVSLLGVVTIGAYGLVLYGFGAFVAPIRDDTGWSNAAIAAAFSISNLAGGLLALTTGRLLDRIGAQPVMASTLVVGAALLFASASADAAWEFVAAWGLGGAIVSAGLFYNATMAVTARIAPERERARAYTWLTVIGGLASPIAFPLAGVFVEAGDWRSAIRWMVGFMVICTLPALVLVRGDRDVLGEPGRADAPGYDGVASALAASTVRRWLLASSAGMAGLVAIQVHHVAAIEATGVSIALAATLAGVRGLLSLPGRAVAGRVAVRLGVVDALRVTYLTMTVGTAALVLAGGLAWVWVFVVLTGLAFGSVSPLQGLYAAELYGERRIGTLMGMQQVVFGVAGAIGPLVLGWAIDWTDGYLTMLLAVVALQVVAMVTFTDPVRRRGSAPGANP